MRKIRFGSLAILLVVFGLGVWQREQVWSWWKVRQLTRANDASRDALAKEVADLGDAALPHLLGALSQGDAACGNIEEGLTLLTGNATLADVRGLTLLDAVEQRFGSFSACGQAVALRTLGGLCARLPAQAGVTHDTLERLMKLAQRAESDAATRPAALMLASSVAGHRPHWNEALKAMAIKGLAANDTPTRMAALHLVMTPSMHNEQAVLVCVAPLLKDIDPAIRKGAILALGSAVETIGNEDMLFLLHDPDLEVQLQCERVLRGRGLNDVHLRLARLISDPRPGTRCEVVQHLFQSDVDAGSWLRRLSQDAAPSVRATAARAASLRDDVDLRNILRDMSRRDPSPTVRELAGHFLNQP